MSFFLPESEVGAIAKARLHEPVSTLFWNLVGSVEEMGRGERTRAVRLWPRAYQLLNAALLTRQRRVATPAWIVDALADWARRAIEGRLLEPPVLLVLALALDLLAIEGSDQHLLEEAISEALVPHGKARLCDPAQPAILRKEWQAALGAAGRLASFSGLHPFQADGSSLSLPGETYRWLLAEMWSHESLLQRKGAAPFPPFVAKAVCAFVHAVLVYPSAGGGNAVMADARDSQSSLPPPMEWLAWVAARGGLEFPREAGLSRWLLEALYFPEGMPRTASEAEGLVGFVLRLWPEMASALSPQEAGLSPVGAFENGFTFARGSWKSPLRLAIRQGTADASSFVVSYRDTLLLADSGDRRASSLYRSLAVSAVHHNSCTISERSDAPLSPALSSRAVTACAGTVLQSGEVALIATEEAGGHSGVISEFERIWLLAGDHLLFVVDEIEIQQSALLNWRFLFENEGLDLKLAPPDRLVVRRGKAGMKLFSTGEATEALPTQQTIHCHLNQETAPLIAHDIIGTGTLAGWRQQGSPGRISRIHSFCFDTPGAIAGWHLRPKTENADIIIENRDGSEVWSLKRLKDRLQLSGGHQIWQFHRRMPGHWSEEK